MNSKYIFYVFLMKSLDKSGFKAHQGESIFQSLINPYRCIYRLFMKNISHIGNENLTHFFIGYEFVFYQLN